MKASRDITWVAIGVASVFFIISIILHLSTNPNEFEFLKGICIGVLSSGIVAIYMTIASYQHIRNAQFYRLNAICKDMKTQFTSPSLEEEICDIYNARQIRKLEAKYYEMDEIIEDFQTFFRCGFLFKQVARIKSLKQNMGDLRGAWAHI